VIQCQEICPTVSRGCTPDGALTRAAEVRPESPTCSLVQRKLHTHSADHASAEIFFAIPPRSRCLTSPRAVPGAITGTRPDPVGSNQSRSSPIMLAIMLNLSQSLTKSCQFRTLIELIRRAIRVNRACAVKRLSFEHRSVERVFQ